MSKANPKIAIELDKPRHLQFDLNAMVAYEEATGKNIFNGIDMQNLGAKELRALLWACLLHEDKDLTIEQVGSWVTTGNMTEIAQSIMNAFNEAMPEAEEGESKEAPLASPPDG